MVMNSVPAVAPSNLQQFNRAIQLCILCSKPCHVLFVACWAKSVPPN